MACPMTRKCYLLTLLATCLLMIGFFFRSMHQLAPPKKHVHVASDIGYVDTASLELDASTAKRLQKEHHLNHVKSRGATIFVDNDDVIRIPPDFILDLMEFRDLEETYDRYLGSIQTICRRNMHLGDVINGGYDVCEDIKVRPAKPCQVYSIRHNSLTGDYVFEETLSNTYKCDVHIFMPGADNVSPPPGTSLHFHDTTDGTGSTLVAGLKQHIQRNEKPIAVLRLDLGGGEWSALTELLTMGGALQVDQLTIRLHSLLHTPSWSVDHRTRIHYREHLSVLRALYDQGFRIFYHRRVSDRACVFVDDFNITRTGCHEISMMKVK